MAGGYAAVVLAGGTGQRWGGVDKVAVPVAGLPMLDRVLAAVADAAPRVVVGPPRPGLPTDVLRVRESPPGGGPVAAAASGLDMVPPGVAFVALLAGDLPYLTRDAVGLLRTAAEGRGPNGSIVDGAVLVDETGRAQLLCGVWRAGALRARLAELGPPDGSDGSVGPVGLVGQSMRRLVEGLRVAEVGVALSGAAPPPWYDCDTEDDLRRAEEWGR